MGSLKTYYFAHLHGLDEASTLRLFCEHYKDVLDTPDGDSHANIRAFLVSRHHKPRGLKRRCFFEARLKKTRETTVRSAIKILTRRPRDKSSRDLIHRNLSDLPCEDPVGASSFVRVGTPCG